MHYEPDCKDNVALVWLVDGDQRTLSGRQERYPNGPLFANCQEALAWATDSAAEKQALLDFELNEPEPEPVDPETEDPVLEPEA